MWEEMVLGVAVVISLYLLITQVILSRPGSISEGTLLSSEIDSRIQRKAQDVLEAFNQEPAPGGHPVSTHGGLRCQRPHPEGHLRILEERLRRTLPVAASAI